MEHPQSTSVREIPLSKGHVALVDAADYEWLSQWRWDYLPGGYAVRNAWSSEERCYRHFSMHRVLLNAPPGVEVDHINGDKLDNRRANLRLVTRAQNGQNRWTPLRSRTGVRNVRYIPEKRPRSPWVVALKVNGHEKYIGAFRTLEEAEAAAIAARRKYLPYSEQ